MKKIFASHWTFIPTGIAIATLLIAFWYLNQNYLAAGKNSATAWLENPFLTFGLVLFGAFFGAYISGEFGLKAPMTFEPLALSFLGGLLAGVGAVIAAMSIHSVVLFSLAGVFTLPAFMITKGWIYIFFMVAGGALASRILVWITIKTGRLKKEIIIPIVISSKRSQQAIFLTATALFVTCVLMLLLTPVAAREKTGLISAMFILVLFGVVTERGTVCMSSMLKEWFISHSSHVWRSVLFTIMCLAALYQLGLVLDLYQPIALEEYIVNAGLLIAGSILMGFGFVLADGCFIGSLWKAAQGNVINVTGIVGILGGIGASTLASTLFFQNAEVTVSAIPNYLDVLISPQWYLFLLWVVGIILLIAFRRTRYLY
jgi:hypothetical protein